MLEAREQRRREGPVTAGSAEETDIRIPGNHRASDHHDHDYNREFHIALRTLPSLHSTSAQHTFYCREGKGTKVGECRRNAMSGSDRRKP
jgi:hypothetical protein